VPAAQGWSHGDAMHVSRFDPNNPDSLVFGLHENSGIDILLGFSVIAFGVLRPFQHAGLPVWLVLFSNCT
jgi:hypothetical protein